MLRTNVDLQSYKFTYEYDEFTVYSNVDERTLTLEKAPCYINCHNDPMLGKILSNYDILKFICNNQNVLAIALVGSRSIDVVDQWSDYDLLVITDDVDIYRNNKSDCYIVYKNEFCIHWYQCSGNLLFDLKRPKTILEFCRIWDLFMEKYMAIWDIDFVEKLKKAVVGAVDDECIAFYRNVYKSTIDQVLDGKTLPKTKLLYHLCTVSHFLEKTSLNYDFLRELKRIRYVEISDGCKSYCIDRIKLLKRLAEGRNIQTQYDKEYK